MEAIVFSWEEHTDFYPISMVSYENMYIHAAFYRLSKFYLWIQEKKDKHRRESIYIYIYQQKRCEVELKQEGARVVLEGGKVRRKIT